MANSRLLCQTCGAPARVHISSPCPGTEPTLSHYCLSCADEVDRQAFTRTGSRAATGDALVLLLVGAIVVAVSALADTLRLGVSAGFGRQQWSGLALGGLLLLCGAAMRAPLLLVAGAMVGGLSLVADRIRPDGAEFGSAQWTGVLIGALLLAAGATRLGLRRGRGKRRSDERLGGTVGQVGLEGKPPEHSHE